MHRGGPLLSVKKIFSEACKRANLDDVAPHTLKHTYITWLLREGQTVWDVAGLTSTSAATIEKHYGHHAQDDRMRDVANAVLGKSARIVPGAKEKGLQAKCLKALWGNGGRGRD